MQNLSYNHLMTQKPLFSPHFAKRLNLSQAEMLAVIEKAVEAFDLGQLIAADGIEVGYEDVNIILQTSKGKFLLKILIDFILKKPRSTEASERYVETMESFRADGIALPRLYPVVGNVADQPSTVSNYLLLQQVPHNAEPVWMLVMEFFEGQDFIERKPNLDDMQTIAKYLVKINNSKLQRQPVYDPWQPHYLDRSYDEAEALLAGPTKILVEEVLKKFNQIDQQQLPIAVIHADFMRNNILKNDQGEYCLLDFGVVNSGPRISDLAVFLAGFCMDPEESLANNRLAYQTGLAAYEQVIKLTDYERQHLGTMVRAAYACYYLPALVEKMVEENLTEENDYWIRLGEAGLAMTKELGL